uniref:DED domain-containing protein n=1 Tax=Zosterops lateralis melanops TaxID=1220523 RepID=A0A8D2NSM6_ZOSLA
MSRQAWEEEECLDYYGMLSLHRLFEVLAAQLSSSDVALLSPLLDEAFPEENSHFSPSSPSGKAPRRLQAPRGSPRSALELLLEMERRGLCHEGDLGRLRQLLRLGARHDLLRCVTLKRPRPGESLGGSCPSPAQPGPENWETGEPGDTWGALW